MLSKVGGPPMPYLSLPVFVLFLLMEVDHDARPNCLSSLYTTFLTVFLEVIPFLLVLCPCLTAWLPPTACHILALQNEESRCRHRCIGGTPLEKAIASLTATSKAALPLWRLRLLRDNLLAVLPQSKAEDLPEENHLQWKCPPQSIAIYRI